MSLCNQKEFLGQHRIDEASFTTCGLHWSELSSIYEAHVASIPELQNAAAFILESLRQIPQVHSVRLRIKDPGHLIKKIIRKKIDDPSSAITKDNYVKVITDLVGIRALHLFKHEWSPIDAFVQKKWGLAESPKAYYRAGDHKELLAEFTSRNCQIEEHEFGYRSVHYLLKTQPAKNEYIAELQVRTLFEEAWSEIDHQIRYPDQSSDVHLSEFLRIFNRLAGSADEMGTFIKTLAESTAKNQAEIAITKRTLEQRDKELRETVSRLAISGSERAKLEKEIEELRSSSDRHMANIFDSPAYSGLRIGSAFSGAVPSSLISSLPTCRKCGDILPITNVTTTDRLCPNCSPLTIVSPARSFTQKSCLKCGKIITNSEYVVSTGVLNLCSDCMGRAY